MFFTPLSRRAPTARLRRVAIARGPLQRTDLPLDWMPVRAAAKAPVDLPRFQEEAAQIPDFGGDQLLKERWDAYCAERAFAEALDRWRDLDQRKPSADSLVPVYPVIDIAVDDTGFRWAAWRLAHIIVSCLCYRVGWYFGGPDFDAEAFAYAGTADEALKQLDEMYGRWNAGVRELSDADLDNPPAAGPEGFPMENRVLHVNRELIHHGAEISDHPTPRGYLAKRPVQSRGLRGEQVDHLVAPAPQGGLRDAVAAGQVQQPLVVPQHRQHQHRNPTGW